MTSRPLIPPPSILRIRIPLAGKGGEYPKSANASLIASCTISSFIFARFFSKFLTAPSCITTEKKKTKLKTVFK